MKNYYNFETDAEIREYLLKDSLLLQPQNLLELQSRITRKVMILKIFRSHILFLRSFLAESVIKSAIISIFTVLSGGGFKWP